MPSMSWLSSPLPMGSLMQIRAHLVPQRAAVISGLTAARPRGVIAKRGSPESSCLWRSIPSRCRRRAVRRKDAPDFSNSSARSRSDRSRWTTASRTRSSVGDMSRRSSRASRTSRRRADQPPAGTTRGRAVRGYPPVGMSGDWRGRRAGKGAGKGTMGLASRLAAPAPMGIDVHSVAPRSRARNAYLARCQAKARGPILRAWQLIRPCADRAHQRPISTTARAIFSTPRSRCVLRRPNVVQRRHSRRPLDALTLRSMPSRMLWSR